MQHIYGISTIKELQSFDPMDSTQLRVAGYFKPGDGGGGDFYWQEDATDDPDNGLVFRSRSRQHGRWRRILSGVQDIRFFGAFAASGDVSKQFQTSDFGGELSSGQLKYAANDVIYLHKIHEELNKICLLYTSDAADE